MMPSRPFPDTFASLSTALALAAFAAGSILASGPAEAAASKWVENEGGAVRIVAAPPAPDGTIRAAVDIRLEPGWTTYWMNPGDAGIPPTLETDGSTNLKSAELGFPAPVALDEGGVKAIGYDRSVAFPLLLRQEKAGDPTVLSAKLFIGICREICIPVQASYSLTIGGSSKPEPAAFRVASAFALLPDRPSADFSVGPARLLQDGRSLRVDATLPEAAAGPDDPALYIAGPPGWSFGTPRFSGDDAADAHFTISVTDAPDGETLAGKPLVAVVTEGGRSIQETLSIQ